MGRSGSISLVGLRTVPTRDLAGNLDVLDIKLVFQCTVPSGTLDPALSHVPYSTEGLLLVNMQRNSLQPPHNCMPCYT